MIVLLLDLLASVELHLEIHHPIQLATKVLYIYVYIFPRRSFSSIQC